MPPIMADIGRLLLASFLGGLIGLNREIKHRPAGLRTNLFICLGSAIFTMLSDQLAGAHIGDHTRIAAQIIPGIGFIGAGSIIHARADLVTGITSAATLFVVASIGMAIGGSRYVIAVVTTLVILGVLSLFGLVEQYLDLKLSLHSYEVTGKSAEVIAAQVNEALEPLHLVMQSVQIAPTPRHVRLHFECEGTRTNHAQVVRMLQQSEVFDSVTALGPVQAE